MSSDNHTLEPTKRFHFNSIWFVPLISLIVAAWMFYSDWSQQGLVITVIAEDADGLEAGKTKVKARNVELGTVTQIQLSENYEHAIITIQMQAGTEKMMTENTQFWVVKPRVGRDGISGLGTLLSGAYIHMQPSDTGKRKTTFHILSKPPISTATDQGLRLRLYSENHTQMDVGTPVHFRGFQVGYIESVDFDVDKQVIDYQIFIKSPFNALVTSNVQFWVTPGLAFESSAKGFEFKMNSLETFIGGGISFGAVMNLATPEPVQDLTEFKLFASQRAAEEVKYSQHIGYIALFIGNVGGLEAGSPVELNGFRIGTVAEVPFSGMTLDSLVQFSTPRIPVLINIEPQRFNTQFTNKDLSLDEWQQKLNAGIKAGMRATIVSSNLLTGAKQISISFADDVEDIEIEYYEHYPLFPTADVGLASLQNKVEMLLDKVTQLPLENTVNELNNTLASATETLEAFESISQKLDALFALEQTQAIPEQLVNSLTSLTEMISSYQTQGEIGQNLNQTLQILKQDLEDLQPLIQQLKQKPNSLILGKPIVTDQPPKAGVRE